MNKDSVDLRLSYILSICIPIVGLILYIISDIFSMTKSTLYSQIIYQIIIDLVIFWALVIVLIIFIAYLFLQGLQLTDNDYLRSLSKNSNKFYTIGFELSLIVIPLAIFFILYTIFNNLFIRIILFLIVIFYFYRFVLPLREPFYKLHPLLIFIVIYVLTLYLIFGAFQLATSDINIEFDKQYYLHSDYVIITIEQSGISYPHINKIEINGRVVKSENLCTSDEGTKQVVIYNINDIQESLFFRDNYNIVHVDVNYSTPFLWKSINHDKFADFIVINKSNTTSH